MTAPAKLRIKNKAEVNKEIGLAIARLRDTQIGVFREVVWKTFLRVTRETPQFSGSAAAHWFIGIDKPEHYFDPGLGDRDLRLADAMAGSRKPRQRGDEYWVRVGREREKPKLSRIRRNSVVYITSGARGDTDNGRSSSNYMEDMQDPAYWMIKLREVNQPYINADEAALNVAISYWNRKIDPFTWAPAQEILNDA